MGQQYGCYWYSFTYDYQNRLTCGYDANTVSSNCEGQSYSYDSAGRLTAYEGVGYTGYRGHGVTNLASVQRYYYDNNGNVVNRRWGLGNQQTLIWNHENRLSQVNGGNGYTEDYLYDADGQRVKKSNNLNGVTYYAGSDYESTNETVWVDDALPGGAAVVNDSDGWSWDSGHAASGRAYHNSATLAGTHQHYFYNATETLPVGTGDVLYAYVYLDPNTPPQEVMVQWHDTLSGWEHRAYWGQNLITFGTNGTDSRRYMGALPATGGWVRLEVPASQVGLQGKTVHGMAYTLYGGRASWDRAGVRHAAAYATKYYRFNGQVVAMRKNGVLSYLHSDQLGSTVATTNGSGAVTGNEGYFAYGRYRRGAELGTENRFTSQKLDGSGLMYFNARYYDPELGQFLSPDTIVPDPTNLFDYNRYMYTRGNPMKYTDPTGHYSNDEIMKHFNCNDWTCVEGHFGQGGSHAGMWGWLYMLQQAENGDSVTSTAIGRSYSSQMAGTFQRGKDGRIYVNGQSLITYSNIVVPASINALMPELGFASFASNGDYGLYGLNGKTPTVSRDYQHNYVYVDPIEVLKAGADIGPMIVVGAPATGPAAPAVAGFGEAYTFLGLGASVADDYIVPLVQGDWDSLGANAVQDAASFGAEQYLGPAGPWVSGGISAYGFSQAICYGTGCPR